MHDRMQFLRGALAGDRKHKYKYEDLGQSPNGLTSAHDMVTESTARQPFLRFCYRYVLRVIPSLYLTSLVLLKCLNSFDLLGWSASTYAGRRIPKFTYRISRIQS